MNIVTGGYGLPKSGYVSSISSYGFGQGIVSVFTLVPILQSASVQEFLHRVSVSDYVFDIEVLN